MCLIADLLPKKAGEETRNAKLLVCHDSTFSTALNGSMMLTWAHFNWGNAEAMAVLAAESVGVPYPSNVVVKWQSMSK